MWEQHVGSYLAENDQPNVVLSKLQTETLDADKSQENRMPVYRRLTQQRNTTHG